MSFKNYFLFLFLLVCQIFFAQSNSVLLNQVVINDYQLKNYTNSKSKQVLTDSIIEKNSASLTSLLNFNSVIYFKENGLGMVASPSFRGTTAQQTAVIWNGININSQLNGQTDFNLITSRDFNSITIQSGGSSAIYGSSAIGGSIHLNNNLKFNHLFNNDLHINFGSFNTIGVNYKTAFANNKTSTQISISHNQSENDYRFVGYPNLKNENAKFSNSSMNTTFGYKFNSRNIIKFYSRFFNSERYLSPSIGAVSTAKYQDFNTNNLLEYNHFSNRFKHTIKTAFLTENYKYFSNFLSAKFETSTAETFIAKYDLSYKFLSKTEINIISDFSRTKGFGTSIGDNSRNIGSGTILFTTSLSNKIILDGNIRKEITNNYESPLLFAIGSQIEITKHYSLKLNTSKNFRIPSFNDLYWDILGNKNLLPESSNSYEIGQELNLKKIKLSVTSYYSKTTNLIQWTPDNNIWTPKNVKDAINYGLEVYMQINHKINNHSISVSSSYAFTKAIDEATDKILVYVPKHKINGEIVYSYKKISVNYQYLFNGYVFTSPDNYYFIKEYQVSNVGCNYKFGKKNTYDFGFQILNIWNEDYQNVQNRPMPGRNFNLNINFKL